ncbi:MAG: hypothetical protein AAF902_05000 [Chloroflexota bacterium]
MLFLILVAGCNNTPPATTSDDPSSSSTESGIEVRVKQYTNESALDFQHPSDWILEIPRQGIIATGPQQTVFGNEAGPLVTILRVPFGEVHGNLEGEFNHFLDFGPKRDGYEVKIPASDIEVDGRKGRQIRMSFAGDVENSIIAQEAWIVAAEANNGVVYLISATAPEELWSANEILFKILVNSLKFNE